jgi:membrane-associated protease RseP (regulator of RpoE activity)
MYVSNHKDEDNISMLENGYDMMGTSAFDATDTPADQALQFGKTIQADTVLVYSKYGSQKTASSKLQMVKEAAKNGGEIDAKALEEPAMEYQYYASYWAKLPKPLLGVHIIKLKQRANPDNQKATDEKGLNIIAVIKDSPAAKAGMVKGDVLLKIGEMELIQPDDLFAAVKRYAGQTVPVELAHNQENVKVTVALNSRP